MIRLLAYYGLSIILIALTAQSAFAVSVVPPGSFIRNQVRSVDSLVDQVQRDPVVRKRYASHFGVSPEYLVGYLKNQVELVTLRAPLKTQVWYVGRDGRLHSKTKLLPRGSQVFATREGRPLILWLCGNPLLSVLPAKQQVPAQPETLIKSTEAQVVSIPPIVAPPSPLVSPMLPGTLASTASVSAAGPMAAAPGIVSAGGSSVPWLSLLAGAGGLVAIVDAGDSGGQDVVRQPPSPAIPEFPTSALALIGLLPTALFATRKRKPCTHYS